MARLELACELLKTHPEVVLLVSGYGPNQPPISEAQAMSIEVQRNGIDQGRILLEERSVDTLQNAYYSRIIVDRKSFSRLAVVTSEFHMKRTQGIFDWVFGNDYAIEYHAAVNAGVNPEDLRKRQALEKAADTFYRNTLYPAAPVGSMPDIEDVLFNSKNPAAKVYALFLENLSLERTLY